MGISLHKKAFSRWEYLTYEVTVGCRDKDYFLRPGAFKVKKFVDIPIETPPRRVVDISIETVEILHLKEE